MFLIDLVFLFLDRQVDHKGAALAQFAFDSNESIMSLYDAFCDGQSNSASPFPFRFLGSDVEIIEDVRQIL